MFTFRRPPPRTSSIPSAGQRLSVSAHLPSAPLARRTSPAPQGVASRISSSTGLGHTAAQPKRAEAAHGVASEPGVAGAASTAATSRSTGRATATTSAAAKQDGPTADEMDVDSEELPGVQLSPSASSTASSSALPRAASAANADKPQAVGDANSSADAKSSVLNAEARLNEVGELWPQMTREEQMAWRESVEDDSMGERLRQLDEAYEDVFLAQSLARFEADPPKFQNCLGRPGALQKLFKDAISHLGAPSLAHPPLAPSHGVVTFMQQRAGQPQSILTKMVEDVKAMGQSIELVQTPCLTPHWLTSICLRLEPDFRKGHIMILGCIYTQAQQNAALLVGCMQRAKELGGEIQPFFLTELDGNKEKGDGEIDNMSSNNNARGPAVEAFFAGQRLAADSPKSCESYLRVYYDARDEHSDFWKQLDIVADGFIQHRAQGTLVMPTDGLFRLWLHRPNPLDLFNADDFEADYAAERAKKVRAARTNKKEAGAKKRAGEAIRLRRERMVYASRASSDDNVRAAAASPTVAPPPEALVTIEEEERREMDRRAKELQRAVDEVLQEYPACAEAMGEVKRKKKDIKAKIDESLPLPTTLKKKKKGPTTPQYKSRVPRVRQFAKVATSTSSAGKATRRKTSSKAVAEPKSIASPSASSGASSHAQPAASPTSPGTTPSALAAPQQVEEDERAAALKNMRFVKSVKQGESSGEEQRVATHAMDVDADPCPVHPPPPPPAGPPPPASSSPLAAVLQRPPLAAPPLPSAVALSKRAPPCPPPPTSLALKPSLESSTSTSAVSGDIGEGIDDDDDDAGSGAEASSSGAPQPRKRSKPFTPQQDKVLIAGREQDPQRSYVSIALELGKTEKQCYRRWWRIKDVRDEERRKREGQAPKERLKRGGKAPPAPPPPIGERTRRGFTEDEDDELHDLVAAGLNNNQIAIKLNRAGPTIVARRKLLKERSEASAMRKSSVPPQPTSSQPPTRGKKRKADGLPASPQLAAAPSSAYSTGAAKTASSSSAQGELGGDAPSAKRRKRVILTSEDEDDGTVPRV
ncbi:hypothetical protein JCM10450v2_003844 [Rhodotorula kratochvilovae]